MLSAIGAGRGVQCPTPHDVVSGIVQSYPRLSQLSSFSSTVYDTAWLSMIYKPGVEDGPGVSYHLFPQCFKFVLEEQMDDGGWRCYGSRFDGILNSLAGLLALVTYCSKNGSKSMTFDLAPRIQMAKVRVQELLSGWDIDATVQVGFEVLVTGLLNQLQAFAFEFRFSALSRLQRLYGQKMQRFIPELIYTKKQTTILHSLEALVGVIDFDRVRHHCCEETGILASPAATAAYLINSTEWDVRAEKYLLTVLEACHKEGKGAVPSAFPTPIFEITWTMSFMLSSVMTMEDLESELSSKIASFLNEAMSNNKGTVGFAPGVLPDADDTARTLMTLRLLGQDLSFAPMIEEFEAQDHFRTYELERNPSFSANCNVLLALLHLENVDQHAAQTAKTLNFVLQKFEQNDVSDKWNVSQHYCSMLIAQAFVKILELHELGHLQLLGQDIVEERIPIAICQILLRTLATQGEEGDWNKSVEETSYSVLTIAQCLRLLWNRPATATLEDSLERGKDYVRKSYPLEKKHCYLWVEKTTYEPELLKTAYCSMAVHTSRSPQQRCSTPGFSIPESHSESIVHLFSMLPNFTCQDLASVNLILVEASHLSKFLRRLRQEIVSRDQVPMSKDKYLDFIPVIWAMCNHRAKHVLPANLVRDMVRLSLLNYQIDEYMETVVGELKDSEIKELVSALEEELCHGKEDCGSQSGNGNGFQEEDAHRSAKAQKLQNGAHAGQEICPRSDSASSSPSVKRVLVVLRRYILHILTHEAVLASPPQTRSTLAKELCTFLVAHVTHNADNLAFQHSLCHDKGHGFACPDIARSSYFKWVNTTGTDDTSCPVSFQFFACLMSQASVRRQGRDLKGGRAPHCFQGAQARYVAEALVRRLGAMCRMYNDYGSAARDRQEQNLNSLDFDEFRDNLNENEVKPGQVGFTCACQSGSEELDNGHLNGNKHANDLDKEARKKEELMSISEFERKSMEQALDKLREIVLDKTVIAMLEVFVDVTDTFGLVYVQKDIASSRIQKGTER